MSLKCAGVTAWCMSLSRHYQLNAVGRRSNYILVIADFTSIDIEALRL